MEVLPVQQHTHIVVVETFVSAVTQRSLARIFPPTNGISLEIKGAGAAAFVYTQGLVVTTSSSSSSSKYPHHHYLDYQHTDLGVMVMVMVMVISKLACMRSKKKTQGNTIRIPRLELKSSRVQSIINM
mmetsp:Transcript_44057/g.49745  ORF Transcript_44057/g.49745 Transcript_44057/m.49745 type:complete len:128 (+) Transcript_44057:522-905(+)